MKSGLKWLLGGLLVLAVLADTMLTPAGALRRGVALSGHPLKALTLRAKKQEYPHDLAENQTGYALENPPVEVATQSELVNWVVTKQGVYYTAAYYGWG